jgi:hypothetical protein
MNRLESRTLKHVSGRTGQVSVELLVVIAFIMMVLVPILAIGYNALYGETWRLDVSQSGNVATAIVKIANNLAITGEGSSTTFTAYLPSRIREIKSAGREITFVVDTPNLGYVDQVAVADVNIVLDPAVNWESITGTFVLTLRYANGRVFITQ